MSIAGNHHLKLEDLPNEILINLFEEYTDINDLRTAWVGLNSRIDSILELLQLSATISSGNDKTIKYFGSQIHRIIIPYWCGIQINNFPNLNCLLLKHVTNDQLAQLKKSMILSKIVYLRMDLSPNLLETTSTEFLNSLFSNKFVSIRRIDTFGHFEFSWNKGSYVWSGSPALHSITIVISNNLNIYSLILAACPNLVHFRVGISCVDDQSFNILQNKNVKHLQIRLNTNEWSYEMFEKMIKCVPNVERLAIQRYTWNAEKNYLYIGNKLFVDILNKHLHCLSRFHCDILLFNQENTINIDKLRQRHCCFSSIKIKQIKNELIRLHTNN